MSESDEISTAEAFRRLGIAANEAAQAVTSLTVEMLIGTRPVVGPDGTVSYEPVDEGGMTRAEAWALIFARVAKEQEH